jgi:hypothetical protein
MRPNPIPVIAAMLFLSMSLTAQDDSRYNLLLKSGTFIPEKNITAEKLVEFNRTASRTSGKTFAIIQFEQIPGTNERLQLSQQGIELLDYIPNNAYTVTISGSVTTDLLTQVKARAVINLTATRKYSPNWQKEIFLPGQLSRREQLMCGSVFPKLFLLKQFNRSCKAKILRSSPHCKKIIML